MQAALRQGLVSQSLGKLLPETNHSVPRSLFPVPFFGQLMVQREFRRAVKYYTLAYQVEPERVREELVRSLMSYGQELMQPQFELARRQFEEILNIENDNSLAQKKLKEIEQRRLGKKNQYRLTLATIVGVTILISSGLLGWFIRGNLTASSRVAITQNNPKTREQNNQEQNSQIHQYKWEPKRFSRGEHRLFTSTEHTNFNQGIEAFNQGYYFDAAEFFDRAYNEKRTDPEALIYYNNALARQKGFPLTPLTLAVVVPVENRADVAQEILRGVAQAQTEFNSREKGKQLLEIVIANDGDNPEYSGQIAQELIDDKSVLGVIGHNDSDASQAVISKYQKSNLAMISPSSTSTKLTSNIFFRTVPSDEVAGKKLSEYAKEQGIDRVVIFYSSNHIYSQSLKDAFKNNFGGEVKEIIDLSDRNLNVNSVFLSRLTQNQVSAALFFPNQKNVDTALSIAKANSKLPSKEKLKLLLGGDIAFLK